MRLLPASLFGRTLVVLAAGLVVAQVATLVLNLFDRGSSVYRLAALQIAARIAQNARILNGLPSSERPKVVAAIDGRHLRVVLSASQVPVASGFEEHDPYEKAFLNTLRHQLGEPWPVRVEISSQPSERRVLGDGSSATSFEIWMARHFYFLLPSAFSLIAQVGLQDGTVAVFHAVIPQEPLSRFESLIPRVLVLVTLCFALAAALVYTITRSLNRLARAADAIGGNPDGPPLVEEGSGEIRRVIAAFNRMQARIRGHVLDRTRMLGAISHDLKTPLTRLRLRLESIADADLRARMERDLDEMDAMVGSSLEFFRSLGAEPERLPIDIGALVETVCEDRREAGQSISMQGAASAPYRGNPRALRRCLENLVENAVRYGGAATIEIRDAGDALRVLVRDPGPGIPEEELERVFEPYYRLETSRNPERGGTGLGLGIARNIARWHGGEIKLWNAPGRTGLIAELSLPRN